MAEDPNKVDPPVQDQPAADPPPADPPAPDLPKTLEEAHAKLAELQAQLAKPPEGLLKRVDNLTARLREAERGGEASKALVTQLMETGHKKDGERLAETAFSRGIKPPNKRAQA